METIIFNNKQYLSRELDHPEFGHILLSTNSLNSELMNDEGCYNGAKANYVDEQIFYFVNENEIVLPENELIALITKQVK